MYMINCPMDLIDYLGTGGVGVTEPTASPVNGISNLVANVWTTSRAITFASGAFLSISPFSGPWNWGKDFEVN